MRSILCFSLLVSSVLHGEGAAPSAEVSKRMQEITKGNKSGSCQMFLQNQLSGCTESINVSEKVLTQLSGTCTALASVGGVTSKWVADTGCPRKGAWAECSQSANVPVGTIYYKDNGKDVERHNKDAFKKSCRKGLWKEF